MGGYDGIVNDETPKQADASATRGTAARAVGLGAAAAVVVVAAVVVLGGILAISAGLVVVAAAAGYAIALAVQSGAGSSLTGPARRRTALMLAVLAILLGQVGLWLFARSEGGVLSPIDYLGQTFGVLVPLQVLIAAAAAWWTAR